MFISSESLTMVLDSNLCNPIELLSTVENSSTIKTINMSGLGLTNSDFLKNPRIFVEKFSNLVTQRCKKKNSDFEFYYFQTHKFHTLACLADFFVKIDVGIVATIYANKEI